MYDIQLQNHEKIEIVDDEAILKKEDQDITITAILTNQRLLLLDTPKGLAALKCGQMINYPEKKEVILQIEINHIKTIQKEKKYHKYILKDTNYFYLNSKEITKHLQKGE